MKLSESYIYKNKKAMENPGLVIISYYGEGFLKEMGETPIWTTNCDEALRFVDSPPGGSPLDFGLATQSIKELAIMGYPCGLQYYWVARQQSQIAKIE